LPRIDYETIWNLEKEVLSINEIVEKIIFCITNKEKVKKLAIYNFLSINRFINKEEKIDELF